jgi:hypothetical protein
MGRTYLITMSNDFDDVSQLSISTMNLISISISEKNHGCIKYESKKQFNILIY